MLKAVIFDFDGIIAHTEPVHLEAFQIILNEEGVLLTEAEYYSEYLAYDDKTLFKKLLQDRGLNSGDDYIFDLMRRKSVHYDRLIDGNVELLPGALDFIAELRGRVRLAIGSGALRKEINDILEQTGIDRDFEYIVSAEDVERSKPEPDVYIEALRRLNEGGGSEKILPGECVVIEDSISGVKAARSAGMSCLAITNSYSADELTEANLIKNSLIGLTLEDLINI